MLSLYNLSLNNRTYHGSVFPICGGSYIFLNEYFYSMMDDLPYYHRIFFNTIGAPHNIKRSTAIVSINIDCYVTEFDRKLQRTFRIRNLCDISVVGIFVRVYTYSRVL